MIVSEILAHGVALFYEAFPKVLAGHYSCRRHRDDGATEIFIIFTSMDIRY